jgi:hypothetical protein
MIRPEHHPFTPQRPVCECPRRRTRPIPIRTRDHVADESELLRAVRHRIEVEVAEIIPRIVLQTVLYDRVVLHA